METQEVTRLMAQFSAELRKRISPTDQWSVESMNVSLYDVVEPHLVILLRLRRTVSDGRVLQSMQMFEPTFLCDVRLDWLARYQAKNWEDSVAQALASPVSR